MKKSKINLVRARGKPYLSWVGKKSTDLIKWFPAQLVEVFDPLKEMDRKNLAFKELEQNWHNLLFHGDNREVLSFLLANGFRDKFNLIYIDPPFDSKADYVRKVQLRGTKSREIQGEEYSVGEQLQYTDVWSNDTYLQFMYERLLLLLELLSENGFIVLHCDYHKGHSLKLIMDEIFGQENFRNEIIVKRVQKNFTAGEYIKSMNNAYDTLLLYSKSNSSKFLPPRDKSRRQDTDENWHGFDAPNWSGGRPNLYYKLFDQYPPPGNVWRWTKNKAFEGIQNGIVRKNPTTGKPEYLVDSNEGMLVNNLWTDTLAYSHNEGYPTEKSEKLLSRIVEILSHEDDLILDCFIGSGTTAAVAQKYGRRWIGCDINKGAIQITSKRLQEIVRNQLKGNRKLNEENGKKYYAFGIYKVNDYDLHLFEAEAKQLIIERMGIEVNKLDPFFDGKLGNRLVKVIDFNHPLTPIDLQMIEDEVKKRPDENRSISIITLGKHSNADSWIETYNKKHQFNKLELIELRTDSKYGKFLIHQQPSVIIDVRRNGKSASVKISNYISPTIIERLNSNESLDKVQITDFRSMIDLVLFDLNFDGNVFNISESDVPLNDELISGVYKFPIPENPSKIAIKIIDMLGEETVKVYEI